MRALLTSLGCLCLWFVSSQSAWADEFRHVGDYLLRSRVKLNGTRSIPIAIKPMVFHVFTDGVEVRITAENDEDARTTFEIYRSDGIGSQKGTNGVIEIIPGVQALSRNGGLLRHLRLSREFLTITAFPGVSDQTVITHAIAVEGTATSPANFPAGLPAPSTSP
jgi:hypothetical protein